MNGEKLDGNYTKMLRAILNKSWRQHSTKQQLYGHSPSITKTIKVRRIRHAGHCWRGRDELLNDVLLWTPSHGCAKAGRSARTYIQQLCADTGCNPEDLPEAMGDREGRQERVTDIRADSATWWWRWYPVSKATVVYSIIVFVVLTHGALFHSVRVLKSTQINVHRSLIREITLWVGHNTTTEATQNIVKARLITDRARNFSWFAKTLTIR